MTLTAKAQDSLSMATDGLSLVAASRRLFLSREQTMRLVYRGDLDASMRLGRWIISAASVAAYERDHASER